MSRSARKYFYGCSGQEKVSYHPKIAAYFSECIPPSLRSFCGDEQVDLARKLQEDPLYAIKKKEMETKSQLLKNPVRLKQLRDLVMKSICSILEYLSF